MNKTFLKQLSKIDDVEFFTLEHHFYMARLIRNTIIQRGLANKEMAAILGVQEKRMKEVLNGAYPFDLRILSKIQAYNQQRAKEDVAFKIEVEGIQFANYKDQFPVWMNRIESALKFIEESKTK